MAMLSLLICVTTSLFLLRSYKYLTLGHSALSEVRLVLPLLRDDYLHWREDVAPYLPLIPRILRDEPPAFRVLATPDDVQQLFLQLQQNNGTTVSFLMYYADWCEHSAKALPAFQAFAELAKAQLPPAVMVGAIEEANPASNNIDAFPTFLCFFYDYSDAPSGNKGVPMLIQREYREIPEVSRMILFVQNCLQEASS